METKTANRIHTIDEVMIEIYDPEGRKVDTYEGSGFHTVAEAIENAYDGSAHTPLAAEDYVYKVIDLKNNTCGRYRINAGGNVKILPEE